MKGEGKEEGQEMRRWGGGKGGQTQGVGWRWEWLTWSMFLPCWTYSLPTRMRGLISAFIKSAELIPRMCDTLSHSGHGTGEVDVSGHQGPRPH